MNYSRLRSLLSGALGDPGGRCGVLYLLLCKDRFSLREHSKAPRISVVGVEMKEEFGNTSFQNICISLCSLTAWQPRSFQNTVTNLMIGILNATNGCRCGPITGKLFSAYVLLIIHNPWLALNRLLLLLFLQLFQLLHFNLLINLSASEGHLHSED